MVFNLFLISKLKFFSAFLIDLSFVEALSDIAIVEKQPKLEGKSMFIMLAKKA